MKNVQSYTLHFPQLDRDIAVRDGETILQCARRAGVRIVGACGGRGTCGSCMVAVIEGRVRSSTRKSATDSGTAEGHHTVRACQSSPVTDCVIMISARALAPVVRTEVAAADDSLYLPLDSAIVRRCITVPAPTLEDPRADAERLVRALPGGPKPTIDITAARSLPIRLRADGGVLSVVMRRNEIISCTTQAAGTLGLAVDLGTTNTAGFLVNLHDGAHIATLGIENPQVAWGADLISRISYALRSPSGAEELRQAAVTGINAMIHDLCAAVGARPAEIVDVTICGNTAMQSLFAGLPVDYLGKAPFVAVLRDACEIRARDLGLDVCPGAYVYVAPNVAGFVGGDHVAALLATEARWADGRASLVMDIGTNTEISVIHAGRIHTASAPSGPALEGGHISCGMRAANGAIEHVRLGAYGLELEVIGNAAPVGVCGSGVVDALASLYRAHVIDARGRIGRTHPAATQLNGRRSAILAPGVEFTQDDIRAVQLAKSAIRTATDVLLERAGLRAEDLVRFIIAGAFGAYIDVPSAITIGLLPNLPTDRFQQVGNAAGAGIRRLLTSQAARERAGALAQQCEYVELSCVKTFQKAFLSNIGFPADPCFPPTLATGA